MRRISYLILTMMMIYSISFNTFAGSMDMDLDNFNISTARISDVDNFPPTASFSLYSSDTNAVGNSIIGAGENSISILLGETIDYAKNYIDPEEDPQFAERWTYYHNYNYFTNSQGPIQDELGMYIGVGDILNGIPINYSIPSLNYVGYYTINYEVQDKPRYTSYYKWSEPASINVIVHRRPVADFNYTLSYENETYIPSFQENGYDPDRINDFNKGIINSIWKWKLSSNTDWNIGKPDLLQTGFNYDVSYEVQDFEGAWSYPFVKTVDTTNLPPDVIASEPNFAVLNITTITLTGTDQEGELRSLRYSVTEDTLKPESFNSIFNFSERASYTEQVSIFKNAGDVLQYIHVEVEDSVGIKTYKVFGPYSVITKPKVYDFAITSIYDLNWRDYYFDTSKGVDTNLDGKIDSYLAKSNTDIKTNQLPINTLGLIPYSKESVKAGVDTSGYIHIDGEIDAANILFSYRENGLSKQKNIPLTNVSGSKYSWNFKIPLEIDQNSYIKADISIISKGVTYGSELWEDTWSSFNTTKQIFYIKGTATDSLNSHQSN